MNNVEIYTTQNCPYCIKAKRLLKMMNLEYIEHEVSDSFEQMCLEIEEKYGQKGISTVPQIIFNGNYIGGYEDLEKAVKSGTLL